MSEDLEKSAPISETESNNEQNVPEVSTENQAEPVDEQVAEQTSEANIQEEPQAEPKLTLRQNSKPIPRRNRRLSSSANVDLPITWGLQFLLFSVSASSLFLALR